MVQIMIIISAILLTMSEHVVGYTPYYFNIDEWDFRKNESIRKIHSKFSQEINVITNQDSALFICGDNYSYERSKIIEFYGNKKSKWVLGRLCGKDVVLIGPGITALYKKEEFINFISIHEAFHFVYQYKYGKHPIELILNKRPKINDFSHASKMSLTSYLEDVVNNVSCYQIEKKYEVLDKDAVLYLNFLTYYEWPAEYFAYKSVFKDNINIYKSFRDSVEYDVNYEYGIKAGAVLDASGIADWQNRVQSGENMINIILQHKNCKYAFDYPTFVKVNKVNIFGE
jgi:hypothetical protein